MKYSGYAGQVLRINLSKNSIKKEPLQDEVIEKYLGGSGFCAYYLTKEIKPSVKAFDEENKLMFANGPFSATLWPQSSRYSVAAVSPLTDAWGEAHSGGYWCAELKMAGYDGIIIEGISKQPVYIEISDDKVEIKTADHLWGKDVKEATDTIKQAGDYRVVAIGRSGEKKVRFACIMTDYHRAAARCGLGAVMGSKNLKAIAVRSTRGVKVSKPEEYMKVMKIIRDKLLSSPYSHQYSAYGTLLLPGMLNDLGRLPTYNGQESTFKDCEKVDGKLMKKERILKSRACGGCMLRCAQVVNIKNTRDLDSETTEGVEYESVAAFGPRCGNSDVESVLSINSYCNNLGMDTISAGGVISWAIECFEKGIISEKETNGLVLKWGDTKVIRQLLEDVALRRTGFGNILAEGSERASKTLGKGQDLLMTVKGVETPNIDVRAQKSMALSYAVSPRGADHLYSFVVIEHEGYQDILRERFGAENFNDVCDSLSDKAKPWMVFVYENFGTLIDSLGICKYGTMVPPILYYKDISEALRVTSGLELSKEDLEKVGERVVNLNRLFNLRRGLGKKDDTLPKRYLEEKARSGFAKGRTADIKDLLSEYYKIRGWDENGNIPDKKLKALGIVV